MSFANWKFWVEWLQFLASILSWPGCPLTQYRNNTQLRGEGEGKGDWKRKLSSKKYVFWRVKLLSSFFQIFLNLIFCYNVNKNKTITFNRPTADEMEISTKSVFEPYKTITTIFSQIKHLFLLIKPSPLHLYPPPPKAKIAYSALCWPKSL